MGFEDVTIGDARLILADCLDVLPIEADAVISDPPYGLGALGVHGGYHAHGKNARKSRALKWDVIDGDDSAFDPSHLLSYERVVLWGANYYASSLPDKSSWLVWDKRDGTTPDNHSDCELAWCSIGGQARIFRHLWRGVCRATEIGEHLHPTQKPIDLMVWCMERAKVPEGATVLDPYMGSGSTGIACLRTGRKFIGIEKDPVHFDTAVKRIERELAQARLFA